ncbi:MAG: TAXI family TRAP transporter solute-binding subunit [Spirochaetia bacterium]|nr:TAXI family TRAP transporter solute-binding subunit [Spirochaetia bacterium]
MKRTIVLALCLILCATFAFANGTAEGGAGKAIMGTSSLGGSWYPTGSAMAGAVMQHTDSVITAQATGGGTENLRLMMQNQMQLGLAESNVMVYAYQGTKLFQGQKYDNLRFVANLYPLVFQATVQKASKFMTFKDICDAQGSFSPGSPGSGDEVAWQEIFDGAFGCDYKTLGWKPLSHNERVMAFQDRLLDAIGYETSVPAGAILESSAQIPLRLLAIGGKEREALKAKYSWYSDWLIPAGTYNGQDTDIETVITGTATIADAVNASEKVVYDLVSTLYGPGLKQVQAVHTFTPYIKLETALDGRGPVPVHPGAEKFYKEKGLIK